MKDKQIQFINHDILGMRELLYSNIIDQEQFIRCIENYNKKYKIKLHKSIKDNNIIFTGDIGQQNIYHIPVIRNNLMEVII